MFSAIIRVYTTVLLLALRKYIQVNKNGNMRTYEQTYVNQHTEEQYDLKVTETKYTMVYFGFWKINRMVYHADLLHLKLSGEKIKFSECYPKMKMLYSPDPLYPLSVIASIHIEEYFKSEDLK